VNAAGESSGTGRTIATVLAVLAAVAFSTFVRIDVAFDDPNFDTERVEGMLKSDPGLLYYVTERIVDAGGLPPDDFRADPRVQHPELTDLPAEFTVGQEFLAAWAYLAFGGEMPLHTFCVVLMSLLASLAAVGVFGLARELTGSRGWAFLALAVFCLLPANYRTIGFILIREDLSFPLFAIHLWLLARAARVGTARAYLLAGVPLAAALATWHAMAFFVGIEAGCVFLWFLRDGHGPFRAPGAWTVLVAPVAAAVLVPATSQAGLLTSWPMLFAAAMLVAALLRGRPGAGRLGALAAGVLVAAGLFALSRWVGGGTAYDHVRDVLTAKLLHLGTLPEDPTEMSFDARLLWQGPFATLQWRQGWILLGWGLLLVAAAAPRTVATWMRGERAGEGVLLAFAWASLPVAWMVGRTVILAGLVIPVAGVLVLSRLERKRIAVGLGVLLLLLQGSAFVSHMGSGRGMWYQWYFPPGRQEEIATLVRWVNENVEEGEAIAGDFMNSTAILAHTHRPIVLQPKYETEHSRRRAQAFLETFFQGTPEDMRELVRDRFRCRYVLFDRYTLGEISPYVGGLHQGEDPRPGTAAELFLSRDAEVLTGVPGYELVYRSPPTIRTVSGNPYDFFRLYRIVE